MPGLTKKGAREVTRTMERLANVLEQESSLLNIPTNTARSTKSQKIISNFSISSLTANTLKKSLIMTKFCNCLSNKKELAEKDLSALILMK